MTFVEVKGHTVVVVLTITVVTAAGTYELVVAVTTDDLESLYAGVTTEAVVVGTVFSPQVVESEIVVAVTGQIVVETGIMIVVSAVEQSRQLVV